MKSPLISLVIVNWNGKRYLQSCLMSLSQITYRPVEIIVVDQSSTDGSVEMVQKKFPGVIIIQNKENTGYVGGNNLGVQKAKGKYAMILNNDIEVDEDFLQPLVDTMESDNKLGCVQPKAINLRYKNRLDGAGSFLTMTGFLYHEGYLENAKSSKYNKEYYVYSVKGAYMFFRRDLFIKLGGLDKDFFIYFEESDFCARLWVAGYTVKYIPSSIVYHWGGGDTSSDWEKRFALIQYRSYRNRICSYMKNLSLPVLLRILPLHISMCMGAALYYLLTGNWRVSASIVKAILWNAIFLPQTMQKRYRIQHTMRKISDKRFLPLIEKTISPFYYFQQAKRLMQK